MRILVLGGAGFIGKNLIPRLLEEPDNEIVVFDASDDVPRDCPRLSYVHGFFDADTDFDALTAGMDMVFHLISTSVPGTEQSASQEMNRNVIPSIKLFESAVRSHVRRIVFLSSGGTVYGKGQDSAANREADSLRPMNTYGLQKTVIEETLTFISRTTPMTHQIVRLSNPYGPGQNPRGPLGLVTKLVYQSLHHEQIKVYGDGSVVRDFIYIDDAVRGIIDIVRHGEENTAYNLGTGKGTSVREVIHTIGNVVGEPMQLVHVPGRPVDVPVSVLDITKYREIAPCRSFVSLENGIRKTADYFSA